MGVKGGWTSSYPQIRMRQVSVGSKGRVFFTAKNDTIWTKVGIRGACKNIPGRLRWIATNNRNQVTGTNRYTRIYFALSGKGRKIVRKFSKRAIYHPKKIHHVRKVKINVKRAKKIMKRKVSKKAKKIMKRKVSKRIIRRFKRKVSKRAKKMIKRRPTKRQSKKWFVHSRFGSWTGYKGWAAIGGRLRQTSIGKNGVQWGVASNDTIWTRTTGQWKVIPGRLTQLSVGKNHNVWGVNRFRQIFVRIGGVNGHWKNIPGRLQNVSVGYDGSVWGCQRSGFCYYRNGVKGHWTRSNGRLKQIAVGSKGRVFGTAYNHTIWTKVGLKGKWQYIPGRLSWIATNSANQVTGTNRYTSIYFAVSQKKQVKKLAKRIMKAKNHKRL